MVVVNIIVLKTWCTTVPTVVILGGKVVARLKWPFCKFRPLLVDFKGHTRAQKTLAPCPRLLSPRIPLKTH